MPPLDTDNLTGRGHTIKDIVHPTCVDEVRALVLQARRNHQALYPVSTGLNWGYGSRSPVRDGCVLVDLSKMNRILNADRISIDHPVAVIEPGVTQGQLADFLAQHCPQLSFNVTGAARATSLLGNALDRGVGYYGPRKDDVFGLEVVTGRGDLIQTGFRRLGEDSPLAHSHPHGLGPMLDGLFFQSNFGIVTSACLRLMPRPPRQVAVSMALHRAEDLGAFIDALARLKREGVLTSVTHIGNRRRTHATLAHGARRYFERACGDSPDRAAQHAEHALAIVAPGAWTGLAAVAGTSAQVRASLREIRQRLSRHARIVTVTTRRLDLGHGLAHALRFIPQARAHAAAIEAIRPLHGLILGQPTDAPVENLLAEFGTAELPAHALDQTRCGLLFVNPALPLDGRAVCAVMAELDATAQAHGHVLYATLNVETAMSMVAVINLQFDRAVPEEVERAHRCADAMLACIRRHGLEPYRARADMMQSIVSDDAYWQTVERLKDALDPDRIIAPGRYNLR